MRIQKIVMLLALGAAACGSPDASERGPAEDAPENTGAPAVAERPSGGAPGADGLEGGAEGRPGSADPADQALDSSASARQSGDAASGPSDGDAARTRGGGSSSETAGPRSTAADAPGTADPADVLARAERVYTGMRSMQADFVQRVTVPLLGRTVDSSGRIYHRRPDRFLMDFSDPEGDVIVADGRYLWMYYPSTDAKQVLRTTLDAGGGSVDLHREFLSDATTRFDAVHRGVEQVAGRPADVLRLTPRQASPYRQVTIWVDREDAMVRRFEIVEENESVRRLELRNLRPNVSLRDDLFVFDPPAGAQVFDS